MAPQSGNASQISDPCRCGQCRSQLGPVAIPVPLNEFDADFYDAPVENAKYAQARKASESRDRKGHRIEITIIAAQVCQETSALQANCNGYARGHARRPIGSTLRQVQKTVERWRHNRLVQPEQSERAAAESKEANRHAGPRPSVAIAPRPPCRRAAKVHRRLCGFLSSRPRTCAFHGRAQGVVARSQQKSASTGCPDCCTHGVTGLPYSGH